MSRLTLKLESRQSHFQRLELAFLLLLSDLFTSFFISNY